MSMIRGITRNITSLNFKKLPSNFNQSSPLIAINSATSLNLNSVKTLNLNTLASPNFRRYSTNSVKDDKDKKVDNETETPKPFKNPFNFDTTERFENEETVQKSLLDNVAKENSNESGKLGSEKIDLVGEKKDIPFNQNKYRKKSKLSTAEQGSSKASRFIRNTILFSLLSLGVYQFIAPYTIEELASDSNMLDSDDFLTRAKKRINSYREFLTKPSHKVLLPPSPYPEEQRPMTLVIELDETLVKLVWDREYGYRAAKRPGLDKFLGLMNFMYEVVIFTHLPEFSSEALINKLNTHKLYLSYALFREHTSYIDNKIVKDLSLLGRDLSQVLIMDTNEDHFALHKSNAIKVPAWDGNPNDTYLLDILPFLETLALNHSPDVRPALEKYYGKDIPKVFGELEDRQMQELAKKRNSGLRNFLSGVTNSDSKADRPLTPMMMRRKQVEEQYLASRAEMIEMAKQQEEEEQKMMKQMLGDQKITAWQSLSMMFAAPDSTSQQPGKSN